MIRVEGGETVIYTENEKYYSRRRLYKKYRDKLWWDIISKVKEWFF